ncbi:TetR/AcrR family transcriptional regulator [Clostridium estertheticum]|uniref:TetR family transcriptional regulator n=2 Tax=Clostridium estertheticum TaxID=238834 RepID=A0A1J0GDP2_9CLOT|nr:TetR/AcrR family transcriptional regulator [Clostridium estertheticum]APC39423.1 TetR family transcriptional regulator [Clostridium estertheticum subsp. estertheticum]MBZ9614556.1 TetR/AcrR family transcriptional regulator [Clostridium estertheticum subsp. laramiense]MCB2339264.1 TetR/AcrR family transcriptional regulator [Clostridium estertheticum]MPQ30722.1 TetR/AcrR family transcriptional regulator [Clostridium estertheticum]MPQ61398.1 TetR/AcrR family transcriptional regulator [Clostrid
MDEQKLNNRQLQALNTKNKIYKSAIDLMDKKGYKNIKIQDICKKAGVSVGSFYNCFKSKNEILIEIYKRADEYFITEVANNIYCDNATNEIIKYFDYYAKYNVQVGIDTMKLLYNSNNKLFITKGRDMQNLLNIIIERGQEKNEISNEMSKESITEYLFIAARGVVYNWCLYDGKFDLMEAMNEYMKRFIIIFKYENSIKQKNS